MLSYQKFKSIEDSFMRKRAMKEANSKIPRSFSARLSRSELSEIEAFWKKYIRLGFIDSSYLNCFPFYKYFRDDVNHNFLPSDFYYYATVCLNARWGRYFMAHKANLRLFIPRSYRPDMIVYNINGHYYDSGDNPITKKDAIEIVRSKDQFVYKKAIFTGSGKGVIKYEQPSHDVIESIIDTRDFVIQEILEQHPFFAALNPSSVNTIRMETLNLNDEVSVLSSFVRIGPKGSFVDNISGRDGMVVGINDSGALNTYGLNRNYEKVEFSSSGISFDNLVVRNFESIKSLIKSFHLSLPEANIINWDIAVDSSGGVRIIEINLGNMNPLYHQIFNGPLFRNRLDEVIDFLKSRS